MEYFSPHFHSLTLSPCFLLIAEKTHQFLACMKRELIIPFPIQQQAFHLIKMVMYATYNTTQSTTIIQYY